MKKRHTKDEPQPEEEEVASDETFAESTEVNSIKEFLELKKLQNRILGKMLEKMNPHENQTENQTKSNKSK